ncbi:hypothetical protein [Mesotoga prima]|uniref:hypothetical protein n=1 Tax=Mesotoga prima TaxID=1184387 RepID=UPI002FD94020
MELKEFIPESWDWVEENINKRYRERYFDSLVDYYGEYPEEVTASWACALMTFVPKERRYDYNDAVRFFIRSMCADVRKRIEDNRKVFIREVQREYQDSQIERDTKAPAEV